MKITALGWFDCNNTGDESYKLAFPMIFKNHTWVFTNKLKQSHIDQSDAIVLGGGDIMSDPFLDQLTSVKKPKYIISASCTENTDTAKLLDFQNIIVRDLTSLEILKNKNIKACYYPDIAFALKGNKLKGKSLLENEFILQKRDHYQITIGIIINCYLVDKFETKKFLEFQNFTYDLSHLIDYTNASFVFIPFGQNFPCDDRVSNMWIANKCKYWKKNIVLTNQLNVQNILDIISACDVVISTRLHSTIFSIANSIPYLDIIHNHKNLALSYTTNKQQYTTPYNPFDLDKNIEFLKKIIINREGIKKELFDLVDNYKKLFEELNNVCLL